MAPKIYYRSTFLESGVCSKSRVKKQDYWLRNCWIWLKLITQGYSLKVGAQIIISHVTRFHSGIKPPRGWSVSLLRAGKGGVIAPPPSWLKADTQLAAISLWEVMASQRPCLRAETCDPKQTREAGLQRYFQIEIWFWSVFSTILDGCLKYCFIFSLFERRFNLIFL